MSYMNVLMYSSVLPSYDSNKEDDKKDKGERINGDNKEEIERIIKNLY